VDRTGRQIDDLDVDLAAGEILDSMGGLQTSAVENGVREAISAVIETPQGEIVQEETSEALQAKAAVQEGAPMYRLGTSGQSAAAEGQYWALENPLTTSEYGAKYGIPPGNIADADFVEIAKLKPGAQFVTRVAENGTEIEVVTETGGVELQGFSTFNELADLTAEFLEFF
jgi:hypothetical protein